HRDGYRAGKLSVRIQSEAAADAEGNAVAIEAAAKIGQHLRVGITEVQTHIRGKLIPRADRAAQSFRTPRLTSVGGIPRCEELLVGTIARITPLYRNRDFRTELP